MSAWPSTKAKLVLAALERIGWKALRQKGSHCTLGREGRENVVFAFHDGDEIGPIMLTKIATVTGVNPRTFEHPSLVALFLAR